MAKIIAFLVMALALFGIILCLGAYVFEMAGTYAPPRNRPSILFFGVFLVFVPTIFLMNKLTQDFKQKDMWNAALRGCPSWMKTSMWALASGLFLLALFPLLPRIPVHPDVGTLFPILFYAISFCVSYSFINAEKHDSIRRCLNGHAISPLAKFCEECGAAAAPDTPMSHHL
jgi:hypothetical protein